MIAITAIVAAIAIAAPQLDEAARLRYAEDIAAVAVDLDEGLALVTIARFESDFRKSVETCLVTGDGGLAISIYQIHPHWLRGHTRAEVCGSNRLATELAAAGLADRLFVTGTYELAFARYVGAPPEDPRIRARVAFFRRLKGEIRNAA